MWRTVPKVGQWSTRIYRSMHADFGIRVFETDPTIHHYRSTINDSPRWGIRSGTARHGVGPGSGLFSERAKYRNMGPWRIRRILWDRENKRRFYPGCHDRND